MKIKTHTAEACWRLARVEVEVYQRRMNAALRRGNFSEVAMCMAARNAVDRLSLMIRYGRKRRP